MAINRWTLIPMIGLVLLIFAKLLHAQPRGIVAFGSSRDQQ